MIKINLLKGDCLQQLTTLKDESIDSIVTDPPYGLSFMGKKWDYDVPSVDIWKECLRVLKPGGHLLAFFGTRTYHRGVVRIEDAGFEIRDQIMWIYGSGFPKSHNIGKAIDKAAGAEREKIMVPTKKGNHPDQAGDIALGASGMTDISKPVTGLAKQWDGWGTALKPANEPIVVARKPLEKGLTIAENVCKWSTGALNIDATRINNDTKTNSLSGAQKENEHCESCVPNLSGQFHSSKKSSYKKQNSNLRKTLSQETENRFDEPPLEGGISEIGRLSANQGRQSNDSRAPICDAKTSGTKTNIKRNSSSQERESVGQQDREPRTCCECGRTYYGASLKKMHEDGKISVDQVNGRWPANILFDEEAAAVLDQQSGKVKSGGNVTGKEPSNPTTGEIYNGGYNRTSFEGYSDSGGASRFFYVAKASKSERNKGLDSYEQIVITNECKEENTVAVQLLQKAMSESTVKWSTGECGKKLTALFHKECKFTIKTEISKIIESKILNALMLLPTKENIQDVLMDSNHVENVENLKKFLLTITNEKMELALGAVNVALKMLQSISENESSKDFSNFHSTVKPTKLMQYLIKLVTPPNGTVLDPFMGSGSTGVAARELGFNFIGCELSDDYFEIAKKRVNG